MIRLDSDNAHNLTLLEKVERESRKQIVIAIECVPRELLCNEQSRSFFNDDNGDRRREFNVLYDHVTNSESRVILITKEVRRQLREPRHFKTESNGTERLLNKKFKAVEQSVRIVKLQSTAFVPLLVKIYCSPFDMYTICYQLFLSISFIQQYFIC